jgi:hypothetical protein
MNEYSGQQWLAIQRPCVSRGDAMKDCYRSMHGAWLIVVTVNVNFDDYPRPAWHASVSLAGMPFDGLDRRDRTTAKELLLRALDGVGQSPNRWVKGSVAFHLFRDLNDDDMRTLVSEQTDTTDRVQ